MSLQGIFSEEKSYRCQKKIESREWGRGKREQERRQAKLLSQFSVGLDCIPAGFHMDSSWSLVQILPRDFEPPTQHHTFTSQHLIFHLCSGPVLSALCHLGLELLVPSLALG